MACSWIARCPMRISRTFVELTYTNELNHNCDGFKDSVGMELIHFSDVNANCENIHEIHCT